MKSLFRLFLKLFSHGKTPLQIIDDIRWEQLDGAEFSVVVPRQAAPAVEK